MNERGTGVSFIAIGAFLIASKYISAAIYGSETPSQNAEIFSSMLSFIGNTLSNLAIASTVIGVAYIILSEFKIRKK